MRKISHTAVESDAKRAYQHMEIRQVNINQVLFAVVSWHVHVTGSEATTVNIALSISLFIW